MEMIQPEQILAAVTFRPTPLDRQIMSNLSRPSTADIRICHYIPVCHFRRLMQTGSLSLCRCDKFVDVEDGLLPVPNITAESETMTRLYEELAKAPIDDQGRTIRIERDPGEEYQQQEIARSITYVHCWFSGDSTDESMWKEYGKDGAGICIESSSLALLHSISEPSNVEQIICGVVTYSDGSQPIATAVSFVPFFHKHAHYAKEQELRIIAYLAHDPKTLQYDNTSERLAVPVKLTTMIHSVVLGRHIDQDTAREMSGLVAEFAPGALIIRQA